VDGQGTKWRRKIAENFNELSRVHECYRQTTFGLATAYRSLKTEGQPDQFALTVASRYYIIMQNVAKSNRLFNKRLKSFLDTVRVIS